MIRTTRSRERAIRGAVEALENRTLLAATLAPSATVRPPVIKTPASSPITLNVWPTYTQAVADLNTLASTYPSITRLVNIGSTVQGRTIYAMEITDNPGVQEDEPEFYYQGQIHGDEPIGMENSFQLMSEMLGNYGGSSPLAISETNLINNMDLWFVPSMNWDGYVASSPSFGQRENANGIDLNRNFPEWTSRSFSSDTKLLGHYGNIYDGPSPNSSGLQLETSEMMSFLDAHHFVASANFHSGGLVVNYPWDTDGSAGANHAYAPDDALFKQMALAYSTPNTPMYNNNKRDSGSAEAFVHGTTDGDAWYPISGGEQDYANLYTGDMMFTIELSDPTKYPAASQLPTLWANNHDSMLAYMETANWGVRGTVTDADSGAPLFAKVTLTTAPVHTPDPNHPSTFPVYTDPAVGDYHRILLPGTYSLKFEAAGYVTQTINVTVTSQTNDPTQTLRQDVHLIKLDTIAPVVQNSTFIFNGSPQTLSFSFSEQVQGVDNSDLTLHNNATGTNIPTASIVLDSYNTTTHVATYRFTTSGNVLPSGLYIASLNSAGITDTSGNALASGYATNFIYIDGGAGADTVYAKRSGSNLQVWLNADPSSDAATYTAPFSTLSNFDIDGFGGNDTLTLDFSAGDVRSAGFGYRLGTDSETLRIVGPVAWDYSTDPALDANQPNLTLMLDGGATSQLSAAVTHLAGLDVRGGAIATVTAGAGRVLVLNSINIAGGTLDLNDNDMIVDYSTATQLATVTAAIKLARGNGWNGPGLTSTFARNANPGITTLGAMEATDYKIVQHNPNATFDNIVVDDTAVLVKYTYYGDTDFNGQVNGADYGRVDFTFGQEGSQGDIGGWANGDFDFNGRVDGADYALIDTAFSAQTDVL